MHEPSYKDIINTQLEQQNQTNIAEYSVGEISSAIKRRLEENFEYVRIRGEISGLKIATSGHAYFNLKDTNAILACTCWRHSITRLSIQLQDGIEVVAIGKITAYPGQSKYQLTVESVEIAGRGALMQQLEKLKALFIKEGLFDQSKKNPIPFFPKTIGIVTSLTGAVIKDIMHRIEHRCPVRVIIWPVTVQGKLAAGEIVEAIDGFNCYLNLKIPRVDVIIVARGGGSIEDLWAFNEEAVVRIAANSNIPLISAVGHETDFTLIDFAADLRAPTPTAAAELAVPVYSQLCLTLTKTYYNLHNSFNKHIKFIDNSLKVQTNLLPNATEIILSKEQRIDELYLRLKEALPKLLTLKFMYLNSYSLTIFSPEKIILIKRDKISKESHKLLLAIEQIYNRKTSALFKLTGSIKPLHMQNSLNYKFLSFTKLNAYLVNAIKKELYKHSSNLLMFTNILNSLDYKRILKRGFAVIRNEENNVIPTTLNVKANQKVSVELYDGTLQAIIDKKQD